LIKRENTRPPLTWPGPSFGAFCMTVFWVLPAFNEEGNLALVLDSCARATEGTGQRLHIVLVDDGSTDGSCSIAEAWAARLPLDLVLHEVNQGLGSTIHDGLKRAAALAQPDDVIVTMDADNTQPPSLIPQMLEALEAGSDLVIASRFRPGARVVGLSAFRRALTVVSSWLYRLILPIPGVRDYTCGFRAYRASLLQRAFSAYDGCFITEPGFTCMAEILIKLRALAPAIREVPMILRYDRRKGASKMPVARTVGRSLNLLLRS
jgi:dolichol-phosphate mannosyltransferase